MRMCIWQVKIALLTKTLFIIFAVSNITCTHAHAQVITLNCFDNILEISLTDQTAFLTRNSGQQFSAAQQDISISEEFFKIRFGLLRGAFAFWEINRRTGMATETMHWPQTPATMRSHPCEPIEPLKKNSDY
jgi:hypothetical protein